MRLPAALSLACAYLPRKRLCTPAADLWLTVAGINVRGRTLRKSVPAAGALSQSEVARTCCGTWGVAC